MKTKKKLTLEDAIKIAEKTGARLRPSLFSGCDGWLRINNSQFIEDDSGDVIGISPESIQSAWEVEVVHKEITLWITCDESDGYSRAYQKIDGLQKNMGGDWPDNDLCIDQLVGSGVVQSDRPYRFKLVLEDEEESEKEEKSLSRDIASICKVMEILCDLNQNQYDDCDKCRNCPLQKS